MVLNRISFLTTLVALVAAFCGAGCFQGEIDGTDFKFAVQPQTIPGGGIFGGLASDLGLTFPFSSAIPASQQTSTEVTEIYLNTIALRTIVSTDFDSSGNAIDARLKDDSLVTECASGQAQLDFLKSLNILIQKNGSGSAVRVAHYCNSRSSSDCKPEDMPSTVATHVCGFFMTVDLDPTTGKPFNLKDFLPNYQVTTQAVGSSPSTDVKIGGFVAVDWDAPSVVLPQQQPQQ